MARFVEAPFNFPHVRMQVLRANHVEERRGTVLDEILEERAALDRLRRLVSNLRSEQNSADPGRVAEFLAFAGRRLSAAEAALSSAGLEARLEKSRLFGADDDYNFYPPTYC